MCGGLGHYIFIYENETISYKFCVNLMIFDYYLYSDYTTNNLIFIVYFSDNK